MPRQFPRSFDGRVVVITGGAGGIGRAFAQRFGQAGARVVLLDLHQAALDEATAALTEQNIEALGLVCNVTDAEACAQVTEEITARLGGIDVLMANAGMVHRSGFGETSLEVFRKVMDVNFYGSLYCTKAALPALTAAKGMVVVTSSIAGIAPLYGRSGYAASKHALHGLFESARAELAATGVALLMVCPSFTESGFEKAALGADGKRLDRPRSKVGALGSADALAEIVYQAARRNRQRLILSPVGKISALLSRLTPSIYERLMVRKLAGELTE